MCLRWLKNKLCRRWMLSTNLFSCKTSSVISHTEVLTRLLKLQLVTFADKLTSCRTRLVGKQLRCTLPSLILFQLTFNLICCHSLFFCPVWTEAKQLQGKLQQKKIVRLSSSSSRLTVYYRHSVVGRGESEHGELISLCRSLRSQHRPTNQVKEYRLIDQYL